MSDFDPPDEAFLETLKAIVGDGGWKSGADIQRYFEDPRGRFTGQGCLVVLPSDTRQVAEIVKHCNPAKIGIVPYGGGTGVVAGQLSIHSANAIILSLERMNRIRSISTDDNAMIAEAGCVLENIHNAALEHDLVFPLSMASKGSCTIGGNIATNAGGIQVVRHGNARDLCLGVEAVLPSGEILNELSPLRKNNTGYDIRHLLIGSEGTLGIVTAATLVLKPADPETVTAFCVIASPADALRVYQAVRKVVGETIVGLELMCGFGIDLVTRHFPSIRNPFSQTHEWYLLVEVAGHLCIRKQVETALAACMEQELILDAVIAESEAQRTELWDLRENTPEANRLTGAICNSDSSVPISQVDAFVKRSHEVISKVHSGLRCNSYGHIGDGNIHHNVFPPDGSQKPEFVSSNPGIIDAVREEINLATLHFGGSISAEHGIGRLKREDLVMYGEHTKLASLRQIKMALDPHNIMNPGAMLC